MTVSTRTTHGLVPFERIGNSDHKAVESHLLFSRIFKGEVMPLPVSAEGSDRCS
jgi:hypothetical protein